MTVAPFPRVGVGVIVVHRGRVLIGLRKGAHGEGCWQFPGGHLAYAESWAACAARKTMEEAGITITDVRFAAATNDVFHAERKHYVTIFMVARYAGGTVRVMEPEKCAQWQWCAWEQLPQPLFLPIRHLIAQGYRPPGV